MILKLYTINNILNVNDISNIHTYIYFKHSIEIKLIKKCPFGYGEENDS